MTPKDLKAAYRTILDDPFPPDLEISFGTGADRQTLRYEKVVWKIGDEVRGLRYGENPDQPPASFPSSPAATWPPTPNCSSSASTRARSTSPTPTTRSISSATWPTGLAR